MELDVNVTFGPIAPFMNDATVEEIWITNSLGISGTQKILFDAMGRILVQTRAEKIDISAYSSGVYFIQNPELSNELVKVIKP